MPFKYIRKVIALSCLCIVSLGICINSQAVFYTIVAEDLNVYRGSYSMFYTIFCLSLAVTTIFIPKFLNNKTIRPIIIVSVISTTIITALFAYSNELWQFYILGFLRGPSTAFIGVVLFTNVVNGWFKEKQGFICSIVMAVAGIAGAVFSPLYTYLIGLYGWRNTYLIMAAMILVFGIVGIIEPLSLKAEDLDEVPYGKENLNKKVKTTNKEFSYSNPVFWLVGLFCFLAAFTSGLASNMPGYTESIGLGQNTGVTILSFIMISNVLGKIVNGILTDKISGFFSNFTMMVVTLLSVVGFIIFKNPTILKFIGLFFGFFYSVTAMGVGFVAREFFGDNNYNKTFPFYSFACNTGGALTVSAIGYLYDFTGSYRAAFYIIAIFLVIELLILLYGRKKCMNK